ncbi:MAG: methyltransferase domain-containing protein [Chloroflexota bacterium]
MTADEATRNWDTIAEGWAERVRTNTDQNRTMVLDPAHLRLIGDVAGMAVLDAGCGEGRFARMLAERGAKVKGIDLSQTMIDLARSEEAARPLGIEFAQTDMADLSAFADETFDLAIAYVSLIDVERYELAVKEVARALKERGRFVFSLVHPCFMTPDATWEPTRPGTIPLMDEDKLYRKVDHYRPARPYRFRMWPTAPAETLNYHRPLTDYAGACRDAGLFIRDIIEPMPDAEILAQRPWLNDYVRAPYFIIFDCVKAP